MRFSHATATAIMALLHAVSADFLIYGGTDIELGDPGRSDSTHRFFTGDPSCNDVYSHSAFFESDDVSGDEGVRCKGCYGSGPGDIEEFEVHSKFEHFTYYRNRNGDIFDTNDKNIGHCTLNTNDDYTCDQGLLIFQGQKKFSCTSYLTADKINAY